MTSGNNLTGTTFSGLMTGFLFEFQQFLHHSKYLLALGFVLILFDLRWGIRYAKLRKEKIKASRAIRRTGNKTIDYFCWISLAYLLGLSFGEPFGINILPYIVMIVIYGVELESILYNYFGSKGKKFKWHFWKWFEKKTDIEIEIKDDDKYTDKDYTSIKK